MLVAVRPIAARFPGKVFKEKNRAGLKWMSDIDGGFNEGAVDWAVIWRSNAKIGHGEYADITVFPNSLWKKGKQGWDFRIDYRDSKTGELLEDVESDFSEETDELKTAEEAMDEVGLKIKTSSD